MEFMCVAAELNASLPYHDLRDLSRLFKDNLANRLLCKLLEGEFNGWDSSGTRRLSSLESGQRSSATLIGLPNEIKVTHPIVGLRRLRAIRFAFSFVWPSTFPSMRYSSCNRRVVTSTAH